jgi:hypothetical protein
VRDMNRSAVEAISWHGTVLKPNLRIRLASNRVFRALVPLPKAAVLEGRSEAETTEKRRSTRFTGNLGRIVRLTTMSLEHRPGTPSHNAVRVMLILLFSLAFAAPAFPHSHHSCGTHHSSRSKSGHTSKTVHVRGYTRKDGTYVAPYDRRPPGTATDNRDYSVGTGTHYRKGYAAPGYTLDSSVRRDRHGRIKRSSSAKSAFKRQQPCPSTGKATGRCPGYVIDHIKPLECGGADAPSNMQWQTIADGKAKDKTEGSCRL